MKVLKCYPFKLVDPVIRLVEGFKAYKGVLGDEPGGPHRGIDYARMDEKESCIGFDVFSAHDGEIFQGESDSWGKYVIIYRQLDDVVFASVYAHLEIVDPKIPFLPPDRRRKRKGPIFAESKYIGKAGTSGDTKGENGKRRIQLHFELLRKDLRTEEPEWKKIDPYGVYDTVDSGRYPQPSHSLKGLDHFWIKDKPPFSPIEQ